MATVLPFKSPFGAPQSESDIAEGKRWFSADELAQLRLPGLPRVKRKVNERARLEGWAFRLSASGSPLSRQRAGRGGGLEYHIDVLPPAARAALVKLDSPLTVGSDLECPIEASPREASDLECQRQSSPREASIWHWFDRQSDAVKAQAKRRLAVLDTVARFESAGMTRSAAVPASADQFGVSAATVWNWMKLIQGVPALDHLPHLAPRRAGGGKEAEVNAEIWQMLLSDYLRAERPTWESCCRRARRVADAAGIILPHNKTLERKMEREVDARVVTSRRYGADALRNSIPAQLRSVADFHALELVNIDGHKWDVWVNWPDRDKPIRPMMVAIQDVYSRKVLAWRMGESESAVLTRLAFADLFEKWGIPAGCVLDNGRAFASKWITGGSKSRFRFKIREEEPTGIMTALGIAIHWAKPYRGQSKPIERAFRDMCDDIAKRPEFAGAWTGNRADNKPENYGSAAVDLDVFTRVVADGIAQHNARIGRRTETANGQSFDAVFSASYAKSDIGKATPEALRLALLTADQVRCNRKDGSLNLMGNKYFHEDLFAQAGKLLTVRFDPDNLHSAVHVYDSAGRFLVTAPVWAATGFLDASAAKRRGKLEGDLRRATKAKARVHDLISAEEIAARLPATPEAETPEASVIRPVRHRGQTRGQAAALKMVEPVEAAPRQATASVLDRLAQASERRLKLVQNEEEE